MGARAAVGVALLLGILPGCLVVPFVEGTYGRVGDQEVELATVGASFQPVPEDRAAQRAARVATRDASRLRDVELELAAIRTAAQPAPYQSPDPPAAWWPAPAPEPAHGGTAARDRDRASAPAARVDPTAGPAEGGLKGALGRFGTSTAELVSAIALLLGGREAAKRGRIRYVAWKGRNGSEEPPGPT